MFKSIEVNGKVALWCRPNSLMRLAGLWLLCGWIVVGCLGAGGGMWCLDVQLHRCTWTVALMCRTKSLLKLVGLWLAGTNVGLWCLYAPNETMCGWIVAGRLGHMVDCGI